MRKLARLSIGTILGLLIGAIGALLIAMCLNGLIAAAERYRQSTRLASLSQASQVLFPLLVEGRFEHGPVTRALSYPRAATPDEVADIDQAAARVEAQYGAAMAALTLPELAGTRDSLQAAHQSWEALRSTARAAIQQPQSARDEAGVSRLMRTSQSWIDAISGAGNFLETIQKGADPVVDQLLEIKHLAFQARINIGFAMIQVESAAALDQSWSVEDVVENAKTRGRSILAWTLLTEAVAQPVISAELRRTVVDTKRQLDELLAGSVDPEFNELAHGHKLNKPWEPMRRRDAVAVHAMDEMGIAAMHEMVERAGAQKHLARRSLIVNGLLLTLALSLTTAGVLISSRRVSRPIRLLTQAMRRLAAGEMTVIIPGAERRDDIGAMVAAVNVFRDSMIEAARLAERACAEQDRRSARAARIEQLNFEFDRTVRTALDRLAAASVDLRATAGSLSANTVTAARQAGAVANASQQASGDVTRVAAATAGLAESIREISRQIAQSSTIAGQAVEEASETSLTIGALSDTAHKVHDVVALIKRIAGQTNLLALNATIEAARAGEAGRGFAVVAAEVKLLATRTAHATEEIAAQLGGIQSSTLDAVAAIARIETTIARMNEIAIAVAHAIEQQDEATRQIAVTVRSTAEGTSAVSSNIDGLSEVVTATGTASGAVLGAADELGREADNLRTYVGAFLAEIRAA